MAQIAAFPLCKVQYYLSCSELTISWSVSEIWFGLNKAYFTYKNTLTTEQMGHATNKINYISTARISDI